MTLAKNIQSRTLISLVALTLTACGGSRPDPVTIEPTPQPIPVEPVAMDYQQLIDDRLSADIPGIILLVDSPQKRFLGSAGMADTATQEPMQTYHTMPTASSGKMIIALLAVQLAEEGLLDLDMTIDNWLSVEVLVQIANSDSITLRQLLNHTSGIFNFVDHEDYVNTLMAEPEQFKTDIDFLSLGLNQPAYFLPGEGYEYSNTGYLLAGLIMDKVLGYHHSMALRERILTPVGDGSNLLSWCRKSDGRLYFRLSPH